MAYFAAVNWLALLLFAAMILTVAVFGLSLSGHFPAQHRKPELQDRLGRLIVVACILAVALAAAKAIGLSMALLPAPVAIIGAGLALLAAPLVLQRFPDNFVDGRTGLITLAAFASVLGYLSGLFTV